MNPILLNKKYTNERILFIIIGESNAGGIGINSEASTEELTISTKSRIWNNSTNIFQPIQIGVNNLLSHTGLEQYFGYRHGFELALMNYSKINQWSGHEIYIVKAGQGGTRVANWTDGVLYLGVNSWTTFQTRTALVLAALSNFNVTIKIILTLGINDGIDGTDPDTFKTKYKTLISNVRTAIGVNAEVYATQIMSTYSAINTKIIECESEVSGFHAISVVGAGLQDGNHWSYSGFKTIVDRMVVSGL